MREKSTAFIWRKKNDALPEIWFQFEKSREIFNDVFCSGDKWIKLKTELFERYTVDVLDISQLMLFRDDSGQQNNRKKVITQRKENMRKRL